MARLADRLFAPVDAASLGAFRFVFGALMTYESLRYFERDGIRRAFLEPPFLFPYELAPVAPLPSPLLHAVFALMAAGALGICVGLFHRLSALTFLGCYTYVFLLDKAQYNNHYYLIILLALLLFAVQAQRWGSLDAWRRPGPGTVPAWQLLLLRLQIALVFFYAGVAKLNADWLAGEPMRSWLATRAEAPLVGPWLATEAAAYFFSWGGMLFDLSVGFLLFSQRTLPLALLGLLAFNLTNHWLFRIGVFPFLVLGSAILFAPPDLPRRLLGGAQPPPADAGRPRRGLVLAALGLYLAVQVLLPLRHFLYRGSASWTEEGHRFSWHMKLRAKRGQVTFEVIDRHSGERWRVDPAGDLTRRQHKRMTGTPDMLVQYAHWLAQRYRERGVADPIVRADTWVSLNRRRPQRLIDPTVDLGGVRVELLSSADWIVPLDAAGRPGQIARAEFTRLGMRPPVPRE